MKFLGGRVSLLFGGVAVVLVGVGIVGVAPALAGSSAPHPATHRGSALATSAVGTYNAFESPVTSNAAVTANALTISSNDTWSQTQSSAKDSGYWVSEGKSVALVVTTSSRGNAGCVYLGTVGKTGINKQSKSKQGPYNCHGGKGSWYAIKTDSKTRTGAPAPRSNASRAHSKKTHRNRL
jgi:hypothetical protein